MTDLYRACLTASQQANKRANRQIRKYGKTGIYRTAGKIIAAVILLSAVTFLFLIGG